MKQSVHAISPPSCCLLAQLDLQCTIERCRSGSSVCRSIALRVCSLTEGRRRQAVICTGGNECVNN